MKIEIQHTLHGYQNGHQLIASSLELSSKAKQTLLFQSDLSGSNIDKSFKTYVSGYPIIESGFYVFAKTWYADEMKRPGCVWTHSLIINFSDLGKIPEFNELSKLFKRPDQQNDKYYTSELSIDLNELITKDKYDNSDSMAKRELTDSLYANPSKTIILIARSAETYENLILDIWSDQWPRLRRNFSFSTGALNIRKLDNKEFDLQVIPENYSNIILRQSTNCLIPQKTVLGKWHDLLIKFSKNEVRSFLWTYGADIEGSRKNYIPLIMMLGLVTSSNTNLPSILNALNTYFPEKTDAAYFKKRILGDESILHHLISEQEFLRYLITGKFDFIDINEYKIEERLIKLLDSNLISQEYLLDVWAKAPPDRLSSEIWNHINIGDFDLIKLFQENRSIMSIIIRKNPILVYSDELWQSQLNIQLELLDIISEIAQDIDWKKIIYIVLKNESNIIFDIHRTIGDDCIYYSLEWLNDSSYPNTLLSNYSRYIVDNRMNVLDYWTRENSKNFNGKVYALLFSYLDISKILTYNFTYKEWISAYLLLKEKNYFTNIIYVACEILAIGFSNQVSKSYLLVNETFGDVYRYAASQRIDRNIWYDIPIDELKEEEEKGIMYSIFSLFGSKEDDYVADWDYCEHLIRSLCTKFIKNSWPGQFFINSLPNEEMFDRAVNYCLKTKRGRRFLSKLLTDIDNNKVYCLKSYYSILLNNRNFIQ
jgi:GTPase-associated protein 1, N-terminal domain type 1